MPPLSPAFAKNIIGKRIKPVTVIQIVAKRFVFFVLKPQMERINRNKKDTKGRMTEIKGKPIK